VHFISVILQFSSAVFLCDIGARDMYLALRIILVRRGLLAAAVNIANEIVKLWTLSASTNESVRFRIDISHSEWMWVYSVSGRTSKQSSGVSSLIESGFAGYKLHRNISVSETEWNISDRLFIFRVSTSPGKPRTPEKSRIFKRGPRKPGKPRNSTNHPGEISK